MRVSAALLLLAGCAAVDEAPYAELLKGATALRVRSGGLCHRVLADERALLATVDAAEIRAVTGCLRIPPPAPNPEITGCRCCGDPTLEFFKDDQLLVAIGRHHGVMIRSEIIGDQELTRASAEALCRWLADRGIPEPEKSRKRIHNR